MLFRDVIGYSNDSQRFLDSRVVTKRSYSGVYAGKVVEEMKLELLLSEINKNNKYIKKHTKKKMEPEDVSL